MARNDVLGLGPAVLGAENLVSTQWFGQLGGFLCCFIGAFNSKDVGSRRDSPHL